MNLPRDGPSPFRRTFGRYCSWSSGWNCEGESTTVSTLRLASPEFDSRCAGNDLSVSLTSLAPHCGLADTSQIPSRFIFVFLRGELADGSGRDCLFMGPLRQSSP